MQRAFNAVSGRGRYPEAFHGILGAFRAIQKVSAVREGGFGGLQVRNKRSEGVSGSFRGFSTCFGGVTGKFPRLSERLRSITGSPTEY